MKRPPGHDQLQRARTLRRDGTEAERLLWKHLRARQLSGYKFRRQVWLCGYIADFVCTEARLVIEADGGQHSDRAGYDEQRSAVFAREGYRVLRFWNHDILQNIDGVLLTIAQAVPSPSHAAAPRGPLPLPATGEGLRGPLATAPLPAGEREGPVAARQWEGEGMNGSGAGS